MVSFFYLCFIQLLLSASSNDSTSTFLEVNVTFAGDGLTEDCTLPFYYSDSYFTRSSEGYDASLATMSLGLAFSAFNSLNAESYATKSQNVQKLLNDLNFTSVSVNKYFTQAPENFSIGVALGYKRITTEDTEGNSEDYTLIAVALRGAQYRIEWVSNMYLGESGNHVGFTIARDHVLEFLQNYTSDNNITGKVKIWITGFSRAAATSNLVAAAIAEEEGACVGDSITVSPTDIYAYCIEPPICRSTDVEMKDESYYVGIHNIVNPNDIVPMIPFAQFGLSRYGKDYFIPNRQCNEDYATILPKMKEIFATLPGNSSYVLDDFKIKQFRQYVLITDNPTDLRTVGVFYQDFLNIAAQEIGTRQDYVDNYQQDIMNILYFAESNPPSAALLVLLAYAMEYIQSGNSTIDTSAEEAVCQLIQSLAPDYEYSVIQSSVHSTITLIHTFTSLYVASRANILTLLQQISVVPA